MFVQDNAASRVLMYCTILLHYIIFISVYAQLLRVPAVHLLNHEDGQRYSGFYFVVQ